MKRKKKKQKRQKRKNRLFELIFLKKSNGIILGYFEQFGFIGNIFYGERHALKEFFLNGSFRQQCEESHIEKTGGCMLYMP